MKSSTSVNYLPILIFQVNFFFDAGEVAPLHSFFFFESHTLQLLEGAEVVSRYLLETSPQRFNGER